MTHRHRMATTAVALALAGWACAGGTATSTTGASTTTAAPTTTLAPTTTAAPTTTQAPTTTVAPTTTAAPTTTVPIVYFATWEGGGSWVFPSVLGSPGDPSGSGCSPPGDVLPDGIWFGYAEAVSNLEITFDLACYLVGDAAIAADAAGQCDAEFGAYCVRNQNPKTFAVPIAADADVYYIAPTSWDLTPIAPTSWPVAGSYLTCPGERCGVWLYVNGGTATEVVEMFEE